VDEKTVTSGSAAETSSDRRDAFALDHTAGAETASTANPELRLHFAVHREQDAGTSHVRRDARLDSRRQRSRDSRTLGDSSNSRAWFGYRVHSVVRSRGDVSVRAAAERSPRVSRFPVAHTFSDRGATTRIQRLDRDGDQYEIHRMDPTESFPQTVSLARRERSFSVGRNWSARGPPPPIATIVKLTRSTSIHRQRTGCLLISREGQNGGAGPRAISRNCRSRRNADPPNGLPQQGTNQTTRETINQSTGTLAGAGVLPNASASCWPGLSMCVSAFPWERKNPYSSRCRIRAALRLDDM